ncbi:flagellar basal body P-ring protein FlgI [Aeoliella mucimassa]|uniref:Flagellar P-ring protein n=1 Tax=Aeoliella mucimassa TaxID=2527972 RepID=A0A518ARV7_9BACT|nr:flagellar basal body P-ring protein FlgI [Aeoliella mucimassa]QDU57444.1 Flagellar P-ring protein precursor [Aeoliella mucimassa]
MTPFSLLHRTIVLLVATALLWSANSATAETRLRNICRLKGQEENVLRGLGLVVGLNGTGEAGDAATMQAIARSMELMGSPVGNTGVLDNSSINELKKIKNAALVTVTAVIPATGARRGEKLDCTIAAINGKSLEGGHLTFAALKGPNPMDNTVYALCSGMVNVEDVDVPTVGRIHNGCQMEQDVYTPFYIERAGAKWLTLVLDRNHASFHTAANISERIVSDYGDQFNVSNTIPAENSLAAINNYVRAVDATNIEVRIPKAYDSEPVQFAYELLEMYINEEDAEARVVINPRTKTVVISGDVRIGDVVVVTDNVLVEAGTSVEFAEMRSSDSANPSLDRLVAQLKNLKVSDEEVIEIIQRINTAGKLHGKLIVE